MLFRSAVAFATLAAALAFMARGFSLSARQRKPRTSPWSSTEMPRSVNNLTKPAARRAVGAFSWPGAYAPALLGAPMMARRFNTIDA